MAFVFYLIYRDPSLINAFNIITIFYNYLSNTFGKKVIFYKIWAITCLIGIALEV